MACITKRRGRYVIDCYDQNGKRYRKTMKAKATKDDARKELREIEAKIERRTFIHEKKAPLFSEIKADWLKHKKQYLRETTWETCQTNLKTHLAYLDSMKINQITTATVENLIAKLQNTDRSTARSRKVDYVPRPDERKIRLGTIRKVLYTLNQVMAYAVRHRFIDYNPCRDAERPRNQGKEADQEKMISILTPDQIRKFIEAVTDQKYKTLFLTAIMTGARQGEILGLKWSDIDFTKKQISINRTFNMGRFFTPKTKGSIRRIDLAPMLVKDLAAWKLKSGGQDDGLVFPNEAEEPGPMNYSNMMNRYFFKGLKKAEIPRIRFHDLRHTYASLLLSQGENVKYVQTQLGHSSPTVTLNVYSHLMKEENQDAVCRLENTIFEGTGHNLVTETEKGQAANG
jgi:integrase